jgi:hypothetical protein
MKKYLISFTLLLFFSISFAQDINSESTSSDSTTLNHYAALSYGFISGNENYNDMLSGAFAFDINIMRTLTKDLEFGVFINLNSYISDDVASSTLSYNQEVSNTLAGGASIRFFTDNDKFYLGGDVGYGLGVDDGGFYYRPTIGLFLTDHWVIKASYSELMDVGTLSIASFGLEYKF